LNKVTGSGTGRLPPVPYRVGLVNEAQLRLGLLGETYTDPTEDRADHNFTAQAATTNPIYSVSLGSNSECGREIYMVE
jgi:hypothetical protein